MEKELYTVAEAAARFGRPEDDLRNAIRAGVLNAQLSHNIGDYLIRAEDLARYLKLGGAAAGAKFKILVIDDEVNFANIVKMELERDVRFTVKYASWGRDGTRVAEEFQPDLCLIDFMLPDATGEQVLEAIRSLRQAKKTRVVVYSAHTREAVQQHPDLEERLRRLGADEFMSKSAGLRALIVKAYAMLGLESSTRMFRRPGATL